MMREIAAAVEAGARLKGIIIEKPLARNLGEADTLVRIAQSMHVPTAYFENQIHMPAVVQARAQLAQVENHGRPGPRPRSTAVRTRAVVLGPGPGGGVLQGLVVTVSPARRTW
jgi:hypothetical protein